MSRTTSLIALLLLSVSTPMQAADSVKIGFVNSKVILEKAPQAGAAQKRLDREFSTRKASLQSQADAIVKLEKKLSTDGAIMSESKRSDLDRKILKKKREFERNRDELREDLTLRQSEEIGKLQREVTQVIKELAEQEKYDVILAENHVVFASKKVDITDKILGRLKKMFKGK